MSKFLTSSTGELETLFNGTGHLYVNTVTVSGLNSSTTIKTDNSKELVSTKIDIDDVTNLRAELDSGINSWIRDIPTTSLHPKNVGDTLAISTQKSEDGINPVIMENTTIHQDGIKTNTIINNDSGNVQIENITITGDDITGIDNIIFLDENDSDKIRLDNNLSIGVNTGNMRFTTVDDTKEFQFRFAGANRLEIRESGTDVNLINPNGQLILDGGIIGNNVNLSNVNKIEFQDENNSDKIILKTNGNFKIGVVNSWMECSQDDTENGYKWQMNGTDKLIVDNTGLTLENGETINNINSVMLNSDTEVPTSGAVVDYINNIHADRGDPNGFINTTDQLSTFVDIPRLFTIYPTVTSYSYYSNGIKYTKTAVENTTISDSEGLHVIYFDGASLLNLYNPSATQISNIYINKTTVAWVYYDATNNLSIYFTGNNEYHGINMSGSTHVYLHTTLGSQYVSGGALNTFSVDGDGSLAIHAQFGCDSGILRDEDLTINLSSVVSTLGCPVYFKSGSNWRRTINTGYSILTTGTGRMAYDNLGVVTEVGNNQYALTHIFGINDYHFQYIAIMGQTTYSNIINARNGASEEINNIILGGLPFEEMIPIGTVIYQTNDSYINAVKSKIRSSDDGNYVDFRFSGISPSIGPTEHGTLAGLNHDDHPQYSLLGGRSGDILKIDTINEFTNDSGVYIDTLRVKDGNLFNTTFGSMNIDVYKGTSDSTLTLSNSNGTYKLDVTAENDLAVGGALNVVGEIYGSSLDIATTTVVNGIVDEDDMTSDSATKLCTQQSIKAYTDAQIAGTNYWSRTAGILEPATITDNVETDGNITANNITATNILTAEQITSTDDCWVNGFTRLGSGNEGVKIKRIIGITPATGVTQSYNTGISSAKILDFSVVVFGADGNYIKRQEGFVTLSSYSCYLNGSGYIIIRPSASQTNVANRSFRGWVLYTN